MFLSHQYVVKVGRLPLRSLAMAKPQLGQLALPTTVTRTRFLATSAADSGKTASMAKKPLQRPISPHMTIYEPQLTWLMSISHRVTGVGMTVGVWGGSLAYLTGSLTAASAVSAVTAMPTVVLLAGKVVVAAPFAFHTWNGVRHLLWDFGYFLSLKQVYQTGYAVGGATLASTIGLLLM